MVIMREGGHLQRRQGARGGSRGQLRGSGECEVVAVELQAGEMAEAAQLCCECCEAIHEHVLLA